MLLQDRLTRSTSKANFQRRERAISRARSRNNQSQSQSNRLPSSSQQASSSAVRSAFGYTLKPGEWSPASTPASASSSSSPKQKKSVVVVKRKQKSQQSKVVPINTDDPIMLEPLKSISKKLIINLPRPNGSLVAYNISNLVNYIKASGDFADPVTRIPFSPEDLKAIDNKARANNIDTSLLELQQEFKKAEGDIKFRQNALLGLERLCGDSISNILRHCEELDFETAQSEILFYELPQFIDYFTQLRMEDSVFAAQAMMHWISFIKGPPNKRNNQDDDELISMVCQYLEEL